MLFADGLPHVSVADFLFTGTFLYSLIGCNGCIFGSYNQKSLNFFGHSKSKTYICTIKTKFNFKSQVL